MLCRDATIVTARNHVKLVHRLTVFQRLKPMPLYIPWKLAFPQTESGEGYEKYGYRMILKDHVVILRFH